MHFAAILTLMAATGALALPNKLSKRNNDIYATFYNDGACTEGAGQAVDTENPGCLNESGRNSIYFQSGFDNYPYNIIMSKDQNCPCQSSCLGTQENGSNTPYCLVIPDGSAFNSFRFVRDTGGSCPANNC